MPRAPSNRDCFLIVPIGDDDSPVRRRTDQLCRHILEPALLECGYAPVRADQVGKPGLISAQIVRLLKNSALAIADLTGDNPNVFYELALRHGFRMPVLQVIARTQRIPFDLADIRTIQYELADPDSVDHARREIVRQAQGEPDGPLCPLDAVLRRATDWPLVRPSEFMAELIDLRATAQALAPAILKQLRGAVTQIASSESGSARELLTLVHLFEGLFLDTEVSTADQRHVPLPR